MQQGAKIDLWGVGTKLITSQEMPALGGVYKLAAVFREDGTMIPKIKLSDNAAKITNPSFKNLFRLYDKESGMAIADLITMREEAVEEEQPLTIFHPLETWKRKAGKARLRISRADGSAGLFQGGAFKILGGISPSRYARIV